ncbi:hydantoinase B/oxoprolinase family protein [Bacterioplanoides sp. SCSIO 12839]|uniref:hydantoinase B/oxoprolinase family protein n=1 Tax=Bacterioplanoides sp. SCSIO 12839 TaxID=2829569 RepID=UPI002105B685|nr:hydantoinase B/oxoprolinase family protein [Bacterioplanoides sp. SCSIO 12839]UTW48985.1 hydantoinase B/oxoprolinase family protein [Bacterioplanoides sp. SCSIO 12839]
MSASDVSDHSFWQFWVDRGGTFTDIVARRPDGELLSRKLLSENPQHYQDAAVEGIRRIRAEFPQFPQDGSGQIESVKMGTTVATNALLERKGEDTCLLISHGLRDQLEIGYQTRPDIFAIHIEQPELLYRCVYEAPERVLADGTVDMPLDEEGVQVILREAREQGLTSLAVVFMHAYKYPQHEQMVADIARDMGFTQISLSHQVSPLIKFVPRGDTTVADAYLSPVLKRYVQQVKNGLPVSVNGKPTDLQFMQSNGGLTDADVFHGKDAVLSGPAGGVVGMVRTAEQDGFNQIIGFDMGGTSTDVSHYTAGEKGERAGELERETETQVTGIRLRVPMMNIHTVAAGGGSIVKFADGRFQVGPESAGAFPGPACYRNGGPLTVTDCNVLLGKIQPQHFPYVFGAQQNEPLDKKIVEQKFWQLSEQIQQESGQQLTPQQIAEGFLTIAVDNMANAVKKISVQRGYDIQNYALNAFGGAGAQHACLVADALGMEHVYLHPLAGVLSAYGIGLAEQRWLGEEAVEKSLSQEPLETLAAAEQAFLTLQQQSDISGSQATETRRAYCRYDGSDTHLLVEFSDAPAMRENFEQQHQQLFGFIYRDKELLLDAVQLEVVAGGYQPEPQTLPSGQPAVTETSELFSGNQQHAINVYAREQLPAGFSLAGPALLTDANSTIVIEPNWQLEVLTSGALVIKKSLSAESAVQKSALTSEPESIKNDAVKNDPVRLEIFNNIFMSAAEQMGFVLEKTATSVNIKERLDFSCAIFDGDGELVANAPHIPVHLGSMSESIKVVIKDHPNMQPGDAFVLNTPYNGGTHLPDVTVVKPVFIQQNLINEKPDFYVAARGHHADIGGITPGSMPANSQHIEQEGVLLDNLVLIRDGEFQTQSILDVLSAAKYPARNPQQNIADLTAQVAACEKGASELQRVCAEYGLPTVLAYMQYVQENAEQTLRDCLADLPSGSFCYAMDDGTQFQVAIEVDQTTQTAVIDFSGTGYRPDQLMHPGNFNAPTSVVYAAVLYSFRALVDKPMPLNAGFFKPLTIKVPPQSIIAPVYPAAVVSGNVETAQYLTDCMMGASGLMAGCQGTNNNFTFGDDSHQYYETLCGGVGASHKGDGASGVHSHMTNSRLTDPEILEQRFPVMLEHFHLRALSGGSGLFNGGHGVERHIRFLKNMRANIISGHRQQTTFGLNGGSSGQVGFNFVKRRSGKLEKLAGCADVELQAGEVFCIHTPGGGGFGEPTSQSTAE